MPRMEDLLAEGQGLIEEGGVIVARNLAKLDSPAFTGTPTAPTPTAGDNTTKLATTAFVKGAVDNATPLLAVKSHNPSSAVLVGTTSATFADIDATNLVVTFTAPASGRVLVVLDALADAANTSTLHWNLRSGGANLAGTEKRAVYNSPGAHHRASTHILVSGLTSGQSYTYTWGHARTEGTDNVNTIYGGAVGSALMEVWRA